MNLSTPRHLFDCLDDVRSQLAGRRSIAAFFDLDGTLASITPTPAMTRLKPQMRAALEELVRDGRCLVSIVSGRALQDLRAIVNLPGIIYVGNHGLEIAGSKVEFLHAGAKNHIEVLREVCGRVTSRLQDLNGLIVEFKTLTASIHYRLAADREIDRIRTEVEDAVAPFRDRICVFQGRRVLELRPAVPWHKGSAVNWILKQAHHDNTAAIYMGDDRTDEDAFAALPRGITIHVGTKVRMTSARYFVRSPAEVLAFVESLPLVNKESSWSAGDISASALHVTDGE